MKMKIVLIFSWLTVVSLGLFKLNEFSQTPGKSVKESIPFPVASRLASVSKKPLLLVFIHPQCSCSKATLSELEKLMSDLNGVDVKVIINQTQGRDIASVKKIEGVEFVSDNGGYEAKLFQVYTSGHSFLFDENRKLIFSGGLTPGRGHEGLNQGQLVIKKWLRDRSFFYEFEKVFGCEQFGSKS